METVASVFLYMVPLLFSVSVHEAAHAWVADRRGDSTARMLGRVSLNPIAHIDPVGSVVIPAIFYALSGSIFAWAKPVPVIERNLRNPRWDGLYVALAGPASNLLLALLFAGVLVLLSASEGGTTLVRADFMIREPLRQMALIGVHLNTVLALLNFLPVPPLDGSRILNGIFPSLSSELRSLERVGWIVLMVLFFTGALQPLIFAPARRISSFLISWAA